MTRTIILGIDGVPFELMDNLSNKGVMPNFQKLKLKGTFKKLRSSIPHISSIAWSSVITGNNPGEHGIYGFMDIINGTYSLCFPNFKNLKTKAFWQKDEQKYVIINVPSTYPASEIKGFIVSGFVSLDLENAVYPKEYLPLLEEMNYQIDVDSMKAHTSKDLFLKELFETFETRKKLLYKMWDEINWDTFMFVITGSDRIEHFLWDAYEDENHKYHKEFIEFFRKTDELIGEVTEKMNETDSLLMLSDHGMEKIKTNVFINSVLRKEGLLNTSFDERKGFNNIQKGTKAFCLDPGRIYLHKQKKYPLGEVAPEEEKELTEKIKKIFYELEYEGEKVIKTIYEKREIYNGKELEKAPDLVLIENSGFRLRGVLLKNELFGQDIFTGMHTLDNAFIYINKQDKNLIPENPSVEDIVPILNKLRRENNDL